MVFFFFNDTATTEIYPLSLPDALPIYTSLLLLCGPISREPRSLLPARDCGVNWPTSGKSAVSSVRSEEHTSELHSQSNIVCRLLVEKNTDATTSDTSCGTRPRPLQRAV